MSYLNTGRVIPEAAVTANAAFRDDPPSVPTKSGVKDFQGHRIWIRDKRTGLCICDRPGMILTGY